MQVTLINDFDLTKRAQKWPERSAVDEGLPSKIMDIAILRRALFLLELLDVNGLPCKRVE